VKRKTIRNGLKYLGWFLLVSGFGRFLIPSLRKELVLTITTVLLGGASLVLAHALAGRED
jgi:hypothetical protein